MRRLAKILGWLLAGVVLLAVTLPWWLGLALGGVGRALHATYERYERVGYSRFAIYGVVLTRPEVTVKIDRAEADTPTLWFWRHVTGNSREVVVNNWEVIVPEKSPETSVTPRRESGWALFHSRLRRIAGGLDRWLPVARIGAGSVRWYNGGIVMASGQWKGRALDVKGLGALLGKATVPTHWPRVDAIATFPADADVVRVTARDWVFDETVSVESRGAEAVGEIVWEKQRASVQGHYAATGWAPAEIEVQAADWTVPGSRLQLGEVYATVRGNARVNWQPEKILVEVNARGEPAVDKKAPPLELQLRAHGDYSSLTLETVHVVLPGITAQLSAPVTVGRDGRLQAGAARFSLQADLAKQPWFKAAGQVMGEATVSSGTAVVPVADFALTTNGFAVADWALASLEAKGRFEWPRLQIASATLIPSAGEKIEARGGWDLKTSEILDAKLSGQIRKKSLERWIPALPEFDLATVEMAASGPLTSFAHSGKVKADNFAVPGLKPFAASGEWRGRGPVIEDFTAEGKFAATTVTARGAVDRDGVRIEKFDLQQQDQVRLSLTAPATIHWRPSLAIEAVHLSGAEGALDFSLVWGATGRIDLMARQLSAAWFKDLVTLPGPTWTVSSLVAKGAWAGGPMEISAQGNGQLDFGNSRGAGVSVDLRGDKDGLRIEALHVAEGTSPIVNATGRLGLVIFPGQSPIVRISPDAPLRLEAMTEPNSTFWQGLKDLTGVELKDPQVSAKLSGTWAKPEGAVTFQATRVSADPERVKWAFPSVESLDVGLTADSGGVKLDKLTVNVEGQAVKAAGRLAIKDGKWGELFTSPLVVARRDADLQVEIPDAQLAPLARYVPGYLAPQGRLHVDLKFAPGGTWDGRLTLRDAASRPLGPLGVLQEISADVRLVGYTMELESVSAKAGGQPVTLSGKVELPVNEQPRYNLTLKGDNLPFVRQSGLLLRGDLDLKLETPEAAPSRLSGTVVLRDSLFLDDVRSFVQGGPRGGSRRPPYFAISTPPLNDWQIDVNVRGQRFMRMRTTVFNGVASARFRLIGTLGEPRAIGEVTIDEGQVLLPFATFAVQQGRVSLSEAQPFEPQIFMTGTSRRYGYDVRMELNGSAASPNLVFSSSPPLDSEQVLLMVMAGETPKNEITYTGNQRFARIGTFLGQSLLNNLGGDAANSDRLTISTGDQVSEQGRETYNFEYRLNDRWSLVGEYDEFDDYNAGVKWRFFAKGGRDVEEKK
jgi:translocation and assembly module TamB